MNRLTAKLVIFTVFSLAVLPLPSAEAGELSFIINGKSYHMDASHDWNEDNYGVGIEYEFTSESRWRKTVVANGFRDSNDDMSYMVGAGLHRRLLESERFAGLYFDAGLTAFLMTRDDVENSEPFPGILPSLGIGNRYAGFNITYLPKKAVEEMLGADVIDPTISGIAFLQFKIRLGRLFSR